MQQQNVQVAAGPGRHAAGAGGPGVPVHGRRRSAGSATPQQFERHHRQGRAGAGRPDHARQGRRPRRARRPDLRPDASRSTASRPPASPSSSCPGPTPSHVGRRGRQRRWSELKQSFPQGMDYSDPLRHHALRPGRRSTRSTHPVRGGVLVLIVILVFLQDWRAMLVPATTVPVTIIGAFAAMAALGLLGQHARPCSPWCWRSASSSTTRSSSSRTPPTTSSRGCPPKEAAIQAMDEVLGPGHRHHAGADGGVPAGGVPAGHHRASSTASSRSPSPPPRSSAPSTPRPSSRPSARCGYLRPPRERQELLLSRLQRGLRPSSSAAMPALIGAHGAAQRR